MTRISNLTALGSADGGDTVPILDVSATTTKKITKSAFLSDVVDGTLISNAAITPLKLDLSVANDAARTGLASPFEGLTVYQEDTDATYIYDGAAWRKQAQWEELGRTTLGSAGDTISITGIPVRKYLEIRFQVVATGGNLINTIRFNNDSATNYAFTHSVSFGAAVTTTSSTAIGVTSAGTATPSQQFGSYEISNTTAQRKMIRGFTIDDNASNATTSTNHIQVAGKWDNVAAQITRIDMINISTGDYAIGSSLIILGKD